MVCIEKCLHSKRKCRHHLHPILDILPVYLTGGISIIGVSAKTDIDSKVNLIRNGADDYITKPFDNQELLVRIEAVLRRFQKSTPKNNRKTLRFKDLSLDLSLIHI